MSVLGLGFAVGLRRIPGCAQEVPWLLLLFGAAFRLFVGSRVGGALFPHAEAGQLMLAGGLSPSFRLAAGRLSHMRRLAVIVLAGGLPPNFRSIVGGRAIADLLLGLWWLGVGLAVSCLGWSPRFWWWHLEPRRPSVTLYTLRPPPLLLAPGGAHADLWMGLDLLVSPGGMRAFCGHLLGRKTFRDP